MKSWRHIAALAALAWLAAVFIMIWRGPGETGRQQAEVALVLGAAVDGDRPSPVFAARIDHAIALFRQGRAGRIVFTGGRGAGDLLAEGEAARRYALRRGVPASAMLTETASRTTMENLVMARPLVGDASVLVVSDRLHLLRAMQMAASLGYDAQPSAARGSRYRSWRSKLPFALRELYFLHHFWLLGE